VPEGLEPVVSASEVVAILRPEPFSQPITKAISPPLRIVAPVAPRDDRKLISAILILSSTLAGLLGLGTGFVLGFYNAPERQAGLGIQVPPAKSNPSTSTEASSAVSPVELLEPEPEIAEGPDQAEDLRIISAPEAALKAFLSAPDWRARLKHSLYASTIGPKMEAYYSEVADGPIKTIAITAQPKRDDKESGINLAPFDVATESHPSPIAVALLETKEGWKVDWEAFVELEDNHFTKFAAGEGSDTGTFHLWVRTTEFAKFPGGENMTAYRLDLPWSESYFGFVETGSAPHRSLAAATRPGKPSMPVLQLTRRRTADGKTYLEINEIVAPNWRPEPE
jgi:hypothetical protein